MTGLKNRRLTGYCYDPQRLFLEKLVKSSLAERKCSKAFWSTFCICYFFLLPYHIDLKVINANNFKCKNNNCVGDQPQAGLGKKIWHYSFIWIFRLTQLCTLLCNLCITVQISQFSSDFNGFFFFFHSECYVQILPNISTIRFLCFFTGTRVISTNFAHMSTWSQGWTD